MYRPAEMKGATSCKSYCPPIWNIVLCLIVAFVCLQTLIVFTFIAKTNSDGERIEVHRPRYKRVIGENIVVQVEKKPTPVQTRVKPVNPFPYHAILVPQEPCNTSDVFLFICVHSAPEHTHKRDFIRETWGNGTQYNKTVRIVFFLGLQDPNHRKPKEIPGEHKQYGDIIQYDFVDSYYNLTLKTLAELQYVSSHCRSASFILKADDDAFINVYELLRFLESKEAMPDRLLLGQSMYIPQIQTLTEVPARMYMSERERPSRYVAFVSGLAYVLTPDTSEKLYRKALTMR